MSSPSSSNNRNEEFSTNIQPSPSLTNRETIEPTEPSIRMKPQHYWAASKGEFEVFETMEEREVLSLRSPNRNTILHIYITACMKDTPDTPGFVEQVLNHFPAMFIQTNTKGETPLHMASRFGHKFIAKALVGFAKPRESVVTMVKAANEELDTALHEAVRFDHLEVAEMLLGEDGDYLSTCVNKVGESPLYIAAERRRFGIVSKILEMCRTPSINGPFNRTALHASAIAGVVVEERPLYSAAERRWFGETSKMLEMYPIRAVNGPINRIALHASAIASVVSTKKILEKMPWLTKRVDSYGRVPLHYAAELGNLEITNLLLEYDIDSTYAKDKEGKTALHIAVANGHFRTTKLILKQSPGCCELVDDKGCNILHLAVERDVRQIVKLILGHSSLSNLLYQRNLNGNTPLHHCITSDSGRSFMALVFHPREDTMAFDGSDKNAYDIVSTAGNTCFLSKHMMDETLKNNHIRPGHRVPIHKEDFPQGKKDEGKEHDMFLRFLNKYMDNGAIVNGLIATVTFTASFTVPGGYISDQGSLPGTPILAKKTAFKAFIVSNTLALVMSTCAIFLHLLTMQDNERTMNNFMAAWSFSIYAMLAMIIAFISGTYAVLSHHHSLAVTTCTIGTFFFFFVLYKSQCFRKAKVYCRQYFGM